MTKWFNSVKHALNGIVLFFRTERNAKIELVTAVFAIALSLWLQISKTEFCIILLCIGAVLSAEAFNSAIERLADKISPEIDTDIKAVKDMAAGAVLLFSIISLATGLIILGPEFFNKISTLIQ